METLDPSHRLVHDCDLSSHMLDLHLCQYYLLHTLLHVFNDSMITVMKHVVVSVHEMKSEASASVPTYDL